jgi:hypothetical protein
MGQNKMKFEKNKIISWNIKKKDYTQKKFI